MGRYLHLFETEGEMAAARESDYDEPWVSYTEENTKVNYNKSEYEKLLGTPLTFEITGDGNIVWKKATTATTVQRVIEYSKNDGEWIPITANTTGGTTIPVVMGDIVQFRGNNTSYGTSTKIYNTFSGSTCQFKIKGNIMSLINTTDFENMNALSTSYTFCTFFGYCTGLTDASKLVLPATTLTQGCYLLMFGGCSNLTAVPKLPALTMASMCYNNMFFGCSSLVIAPELPATTLAERCYFAMFRECVSLTTPPGLPILALAEKCYYNMFSGCTSLTTAPDLPATALVTDCYSFMFAGCTNLNYIKCLATSLITHSIDGWVEGVQTNSGTFVKAASMNDWPIANVSNTYSGRPQNWTVEDAA